MEIIRSRDTLRKTKIFILPDVTVGASELPIEIVAEVVVLTPTKTSCARESCLKQGRRSCCQESHSTAADLLKSNAPGHTDADIKAIFEDIHNAYICLVSSPFYVPGTPIDSSSSAAARKFDQVIERILSVPPAISKP
nr:trafficking protein particle complex subunit [Hymenolepis microstoma]